MENEYTIVLSDPELLSQVCGTNDSNLKLIEKHLGVPVFTRGNELSITEQSEDVKQKFKFIIDRLTDEVSENSFSGKDLVESILNTGFENTRINQNFNASDYAVTIPGSTRKIYPKTKNQARLIEAFRKNDLVFATGPAGSGKTFLAIAESLRLLLSHKINSIILTRPIVEAGESLGFLPGDLQEKVDPYLRPLYDALYDVLGREASLRLKEKEVIEVVPLAYMRGRTLDNSYIILDEAQNATKEQMKMFLTRMGFGSKVIVTGDITQIDLPKGKRSGLIDAMRILKGVEGIAFCELTDTDVVRHPLVRRIVNAYDRYLAKHPEWNDD